MIKKEVGGACGTQGRQERYILGFGEEPERKRPFGRPRPKWKGNIIMDLQEVGWGGMD